MYKQYYSPQKLSKIEEVVTAFQGYLDTSPYILLQRFDKIHIYYYFSIYPKFKQGQPILDEHGLLTYADMDEPILIQDAEALCSHLLDEIAHDVVEETGKKHTIKELDEEEQAEMKRRAEPYLRSLPRYWNLLEDYCDEPYLLTSVDK